MGVDRSDYIMYGWKLPYKLKDNEGNEIDIWDEKFESVMCGFPGEEFLVKVLRPIVRNYLSFLRK